MDIFPLKNRKLFSSITIKTAHICNFVDNMKADPAVRLAQNKFCCQLFVIKVAVLAEIGHFLMARVIEKTDVFPSFLYTGYMRENRWPGVCRPLWTKQWSNTAAHYHMVGGVAGNCSSECIQPDIPACR